MNGNSVVVITGANSGMGKASAKALAKTGARILMLCRNRERGDAAAADVRISSGNDSIELILCDFTSQAGSGM